MLSPENLFFRLPWLRAFTKGKRRYSRTDMSYDARRQSMRQVFFKKGVLANRVFIDSFCYGLKPVAE